ncbi:MAG TPA: amidase [Lacipirellulaceae bacterium]|nr:amidase [Lacipirellulaceae bacterium]
MTRHTRVSYNPNFPDRRAFLASGVAGGLFGAALPAVVRGEAENGASSPAASDPSFELSELSIDELQEGMKSGRFTARSLAEKYLAQIEAVDRNGPALRSVIEVNPDALAMAEEADRQRKSGVPRGPLHGIPILVKDNIDTADKMATTAGSLALVGAKPPEDSFVVKQLRKAGAVLLGKTNLSEWANIRSSHSTSGWSGRGGLTRNPYALDRNPCGSSSGSGAAAAANLCAVAVGTETDGSILSPSSVCGIVGIKPTIGLVSRTGIIPISHSQDTAGPMTRTVRDAAILLGVLAGVDPQDAVTSESKEHAKSDYTQFLDAAGLKGAKIGVARNYFDFHDGAEAVMKAALDAMKQAGAELIDTNKMSVAEESGSSEGMVLRYELKADMAAYLARLGAEAPVKSLKDIIEFNNRNKDTELQYFGQNILESAEEKGPLTDYQYVEALARCRRLARTEGIDAAMDEHKLDAIVAPTIGPACMSDLINGDRWLGGSTSPAAVAGYPSITVPAGFVFGLPLGISFFSRAWSEPTLLKIAYAFEQATKHRKPPRFLPTAELGA